MSDVSVTSCDGCGKRTEDYYDEPGWIRIESFGVLEITLMHGRRKDRQAKTTYHNPLSDADGYCILDFCSRHCFGDWVWKKKRPAVGKYG